MHRNNCARVTVCCCLLPSAMGGWHAAGCWAAPPLPACRLLGNAMPRIYFLQVLMCHRDDGRLLSHCTAPVYQPDFAGFPLSAFARMWKVCSEVLEAAGRRYQLL